MKMVQTYIFLIVLFIVILSSACEKNLLHHMNGTGKQITITRYVQPFHSLQIDDDIEVHFVFKSSNSNMIEISGGENLLTHISTEVIDSVLVLKNNNMLKWSRNYEKSKIKCNIYVNNIRHITYNGIGHIYFSDTLETSIFQIESWSGMGDIYLNVLADSLLITLHTGAPKIILNGAAHFAHYYINSYGTIEALGCEVEHLSVHARGTNNSFVTASETMGVTIDYVGHVYYKGNPTILWLAENSNGSLIKIE
jgi:hypothetical protein